MRSLVGVMACGMAAAAAVGQTPGFHLVGLPPEGTSSAALGLSRDGAVAVGTSVTSTRLVAFRWTAAGGREDYGLLPGMPMHTRGLATSSDGGVIAGTIVSGSFESASVRIGSGLVQDLGILPGHHSSRANAISGDGRFVVGQNMGGTGTNYTYGQAFIWTAQAGMEPLPHLRPEGYLTQARGISRDGGTVVGMSRAGLAIEPFAWTQAGGMIALPFLPGAVVPEASANAVNADGSVIVGNAKSATPQGFDHAVRWTASGVQDLGGLPGSTTSFAVAVSDDGMVVGGFSRISQVQTPFVWTLATGVVPLTEYLASAGVVIPQGWTMTDLLAISGDGLTFAGQARSAAGVRQGFVATVPAPAGLVVLGLGMLMRRRRYAVSGREMFLIASEI